MMRSVLLKLHSPKVMDIGGVAFHFFQNKFHFRLRNDLLLVHADDAGFLAKFSGPTAPTRPDAESNVIDGQGGRGHNTEHSDERLHTVDFASDILAKNGALQVRKN